MLLKTKEFKEAANIILLATELDRNAANLELSAHDGFLYLNVTNREFYVSEKFPLEQPEDFRAVVEAKLFLNLISGITTEEFELLVDNNIVLVKSGKSKYKLPMIFENDQLMKLPVISIGTKTIEMVIENDILKSILNVNSKEVAKVKNSDVNELQKLYYIDESGAFTFTTGACLNAFTLEKPVKMLLNDRIVKLFKLFNEDINFAYGYDALPDGNMLTKVQFMTSNIYMAAIITCDDVLLTKVQGPCNATKRFIAEAYSNSLVLSANTMLAAISRLMLFTKNSIDKTNMSYVQATVKISAEELSIIDKQGNCEVCPVENESSITEDYEMDINLADLKLVFDSCKNEHVTFNCGNHKSVVITHGTISNLIPESRK